MKPIPQSFLDIWNPVAQYISFILVGIGLIVFLGYWLRLLLIKDLKDKYDFINANEITSLWRTVFILTIGIAVYFNTVFPITEWVWFSVRLFLTISLSFIVALSIKNMLLYYYPFYMEKKLRKLRYKPRISPDGSKMKLLSEEEEDAYLDEGMQAEENTFSIDYDVWIDEASGYTKVEKYHGRLHALECSNCNYRTLKLEREEVIWESTDMQEGELLKYFDCSYCGHKERHSYVLPKKGSSDAIRRAEEA